VYLAEQQPLQEGEEKHIISVFVADESGLINRVAGVFARRGEAVGSGPVAAGRAVVANLAAAVDPTPATVWAACR
jgi:hypothetical protein